MTIRELYLDAIKYEKIALVYCIYYLLMEEKVSLDEPVEKLDLQQADNEKVAQLIKKNVLGIEKVGIYSLKMNQDEFAMIFAKNEQEAVNHYIKTFHQRPLNCHEISLEFKVIRGKKIMTFRELRQEYDQFPAIAGYCDKLS